jgi:hypothetical protein
VASLQLQLSDNEVERQTEQYFWQLAALQEKMKTVNAVDTLLGDIYKDVDVAVRAGIAMRNDLLGTRTFTYTLRRFCDTFHPHLVCLSQMGTFVATTTAKIQRKNCRAARTVVPLHRQKEQTTFQ